MVCAISLGLAVEPFPRFARFANLRMAAKPVSMRGFARFAGFASTHAEIAKSEVC